MPTARRIVQDDLSDPQVADLLRIHLAGMHEHSPPESVHALGIEALRAPEVTFFSAWEGGSLLGFGALKELVGGPGGHGEVKSMRTAEAWLRRGVGASILTRIIEEARARRYRRLSLETGSGDAFDAAHELYRRFGFVACGPFADYRDDPFSRFFTLDVDGWASSFEPDGPA